MSPGTFLFVVNGEAPVGPADSDLDPAHPKERPKGKRPHVKSRRGCVICKQRRVKCDEQLPCANCIKRGERCIHPQKAGCTSTQLSIYSPQPQPTGVVAVDNSSVNLLHLELFSHFEKDLVDTLAFSDIWPRVLPWSFQEPYIMYAVLCLAAMHLSTLRPQTRRYSDTAAQLLGMSTSFFGEMLSRPMTARNSEALMAVSILMHYISWSRVEFVEEHNHLMCYESNDTLTAHLSNDPLLQLSFGVRAILYESFRHLSGSDSVFLKTGLYSPRYTIEEAITQQGDDPCRFVDHFMAILDNHFHQPLCHGDDQPSPEARPLTCPYTNQCNSEVTSAPQQGATRSSQRSDFEDIAKRLSLLFCLVSMSASIDDQSASHTLTRLQPDVERLFFSFPIHYSKTFRDPALRGDAGALILLCHFYRAARILLTSPGTWWARRRSRVIESRILQDLTLRGLESCVLGDKL
ncbi:hypothetical protein F5Y14DRAFT_418506 [Nemania sp. NC0429]|nr:hypothetical protein F5Y14DRAFT_418506 [Nemania sp. NC0429]